MIVVRYATLAALVVWIGAMVDQRFGDVFRKPQLIAFACGGVSMVGLFVLKFLGPPPIAFPLRAGITVLMLISAAVATGIAPPGVSRLLLTANIVLGFVLLTWYVRE